MELPGEDSTPESEYFVSSSLRIFAHQVGVPGLQVHCRKFSVLHLCVCRHLQRLGQQVDAMLDLTAEARSSIEAVTLASAPRFARELKKATSNDERGRCHVSRVCWTGYTNACTPWTSSKNCFAVGTVKVLFRTRGKVACVLLQPPRVAEPQTPSSRS